MKKIFLVLTLIVAFQTVKAQKEIYISDDSNHTVSMQGVFIDVAAKYNLDAEIPLRFHYDISYFNEIRTFNSFTMLLSAGFSYNQIKRPIYNNYSLPLRSDYYYSKLIGLNLGVSPRYYFSLNSRTSEKRGNLNSGWFIGLPLSLSYVLNKPDNYYIDKSTGIKYDFDLSFSDKLNYNIGLNLGYRHAFTNNLFGEVAIGENYSGNNISWMESHFSIDAKIALGYAF